MHITEYEYFTLVYFQLGLNDVLIGEVWLSSGQSNMEMPLKGFIPGGPVDNSAQEIANANYPAIRIFTVKRNLALEVVDTLNGQWMVCSPESAGDFSATAYFFARKLFKELNVPIGIINSNFGGTPVESWISQEKILSLGEFKKELEAIKSLDRGEIQAFLSKFPTVSVPTDNQGWNNLDLRDEAFLQPAFDDSSWGKVNLPGLFEELFNDTKIDGAFWFREKVFIEDISSDCTFIIDGGIDDMDITYFNGQKIGSTNCWDCPRNYVIPKSMLVKGLNTISIRVIDTGGPGGFKGKMLLKNMSGKEIQINGEWRFNHIADILNNKFYLYHLNPDALKTRPSGFAYASIDSSTPGILFNDMIHPLIPYKIKGAIWYQGENNVGRAEQYEKLFPSMIEDWRARWNSDFSFYYVQIAPFNYGNELSPALRDAQRKSLKTRNTGMVVTLDIGNPTNIHPSNKQDVAARLAGLALANDYGKNIVASGPLYKNYRISGSKIILEFDYTGSGLMSKDSKLSGFEIAGADKNYVPATAKIVGDKVQVFSLSIAKPKYARYAWRDYCIATLFNKEGLPASSFTTEK